MPRATLGLLRALAGAVLLSAGPGLAQQPAAPEAAPAAVAPAGEPSRPASGGRVLGGHVFTPSPLVTWPFTATSFVSQMLLLYGTTDGHATVGDQDLSGSLDYAGLGALVGYEKAFRDRFSARVWLNDQLYSGITGRAVAIVGTQVRFGFGVGGTASMPLGDTLRVGALLDVSNTPSIALTILEGLRGVVDSCEAGDCEIRTGDAIDVESVLSVEPAVALAWAPTPPLGVTANVTYLWLDGDGSTGTADAMRLSGATDLDLNPWVHVPVGLQAAVSWVAPLGESSLEHQTDLGLGIFYTGRQDLSLSFGVTARRFSVQPGIADTSWSTYLVNIGLRYYW